MNTEQLAKELREEFEGIIEGKINNVQSRQLIESVFNKIGDLIADDVKVKILGFADFESVERSARKGRNIQTGEEIEIAAKKAPKFKALKGLKDKVEGK